MAEFRTVAAEIRHEIDKVKGSRFLATLVPVQDEAEIDAALSRIRAEFRDATHNCWAWRLGRDSERFRYSDDGEPSGSAGRPMLQQIDGRGLTNVLAIVTRFYGGTKLGVGGLVRAYGQATSDALDHAEIATVRIRTRIEITYGYDLSNAIQSLIAATDLEVVTSEYGSNIRIEVLVPEENVNAFLDDLRDRTADRAIGRILDGGATS
ncbi:MAG: YigZ family protein [Planctomycetes bacterium]|nr:YigZ family protein [Planctomycetota bacterium]